MGECEGFGGFARNVAAAAPDLKVIIWDRPNMGRSGINFGNEVLSIEEAEDLHVLIDRLGIAPAAFYGMSSGARSNMVLAERYPDDVAAFVIAPLTGGPIAATQLPKEYYLKYVTDETLTSMEEVAKTPLWSAYIERNGPEGREELMRQDVGEFLAAMMKAGEHLQSYSQKTALGMTDEQLDALTVPATLILPSRSGSRHAPPDPECSSGNDLAPELDLRNRIDTRADSGSAAAIRSGAHALSSLRNLDAMLRQQVRRAGSSIRSRDQVDRPGGAGAREACGRALARCGRACRRTACSRA